MKKTFHFAPSITKNETIVLKCETFIFKNDGNTSVILDNRFILPPTGVISFSLSREGEYFEQKVSVKFGIDNEVEGKDKPVQRLLNYGFVAVS